MTLTELKYIVAVARARHFGKAAQTCFISQPTLSVAVKKLEAELNVTLFERSNNDITLTAIGEKIIAQAQLILTQTAQLKELAKLNAHPLLGPLSVGIIYTIAPYLLPMLMRQVMDRTPQMPLMLHENYTHGLLEMLREGSLECAILAEPFDTNGLAHAPLYDEPYRVAVPSQHALAGRSTISVAELATENLFLLSKGHCFRDHVLDVCPDHAPRYSAASTGGSTLIRQSLEGSSLETIKHMVAAGMGITLVPCLAVQANPLIKYIPLETPAGQDKPTRRICLVWRRSFTRYEAIAALRNAVYACDLEGISWCKPRSGSDDV